ncbi:MAG: hypothetical protein GXP57_07880 [Deltaproteobacteria bacterium]|nr:hypothetical protein [Deltaproteobacteria bacterium]
MKAKASRTLCRPLLSLLFLFVFHLPSASAGTTLIGVVMPDDTPYYSAMHRAFVKELKSLTPTGQRLNIIMQRPFPDPIALSNTARKLVAADVNLIVAYGSPATLAVIQEKTDIPLVYAGVYNPEAAAVKGKNVTGCGFKVPLTSILRYLKSLKRISRLSVIYSSLEEDSVRQADELERLTREQHIRLTKINIKSRRDIEKLDSTIDGGAFFITGSAIVNSFIGDIIPMLQEKMAPSAGIFPDQTAAGVTLALYQPPAEQGKKAAEMAARILWGTGPKNIAPAVLRDTELVVNLRAAHKIGINFPIHLIVEATKVIK